MDLTRILVLAGAGLLGLASWWSMGKSKKKNKPKTNYVECPNRYDGNCISLFLGGGINQCPDWQSDIRTFLNKKCPNLVLFNPRRNSYDIKDATQTPIQIKWEFDCLRQATGIMFWFCAETVCPITLYELGTWTQISKQTGKKIFIGCHPNYQKLNDVIIQTELVLGSAVKVAMSLDEIAAQLEDWYNNY